MAKPRPSESYRYMACCYMMSVSNIHTHVFKQYVCWLQLPPALGATFESTIHHTKRSTRMNSVFFSAHARSIDGRTFMRTHDSGRARALPLSFVIARHHPHGCFQLRNPTKLSRLNPPQSYSQTV